MSGLERAAYVSLLGFAAAPQFSIAASDILLGLSALLWLAVVIINRERIEVPRMFWPLAAYAGATLVASLFSVDRAVSFADCKQLLLFAIVPITYRLFRGERSLTVVDVVITVGALNAVYGIVQYGILDFDNVARRVQGNLGHYMTYSGVIMLVACIAVARVMFRRRERIWAALVLPAVLVALVLTLSRNAWVGACAGIGTLFLLRDLRSVFRMAALLPVALGLVIAFAPAAITDRFSSALSLKDTVRRQRNEHVDACSRTAIGIAMIKSGFRIIKDNPLTGVGPDMVIQVYPGYREPTAVSQRNSHLHNVPLQIAAERGLPALAIWCWFVATLLVDFLRLRRTSPLPSLAAARHRLRRRDAGRRHVRIQFRRLRVPDAVSGARHAPLRRRTRSGAGRRTEGRLVHAARFPALDELLDRLAGRSILVIGDLMLDHFVIGTVDRISPEAPVPIVRFDHETWRLGGAANVAHNVVALGGRVDAIGVVGNDRRRRAAARRSRRAFDRHGGHHQRPVTLHDAQAARRDDAQPAGGADRLRGRQRDRCGDRGDRRQADWRAGGFGAGDRHLRLPEGSRDAAGRRRRCATRRAPTAFRCSSIPRSRISIATRGATVDYAESPSRRNR